MQYRLRTLLLVVLALSVALAIAAKNVGDFQQAIGSHPADLIALFERYAVVWGAAFCASFVLAIIFAKTEIAPPVLFCVLSLVGVLANFVMPFGML